MNVTREVILDLLPVYLSGEASPATKSLVEQFLKQDPELAKKIRSEWIEKMSAAVPSVLPPELELKAFRKTKRLLGWQKWLLGFAVFFTSISASLEFTISGSRITTFRFFLQDYPVEWSLCLGLAAVFWIGYFAMRHRLRATAF
jgi:predicted anti-sigma-YlaC factor YlaD